MIPGRWRALALAWVRSGHGIWGAMNAEALDARLQAMEQVLVAAQAYRAMENQRLVSKLLVGWDLPFG